MRTIGGRPGLVGPTLAMSPVSDPITRFRTLYKSTFDGIYAYAARALVPDHSEIDDVVAEVYLVAWRRID